MSGLQGLELLVALTSPKYVVREVFMKTDGFDSAVNLLSQQNLVMKQKMQ